jgi:hypothetical protein
LSEETLLQFIRRGRKPELQITLHIISRHTNTTKRKYLYHAVIKGMITVSEKFLIG